MVNDITKPPNRLRNVAFFAKEPAKMRHIALRLMAAICKYKKGEKMKKISILIIFYIAVVFFTNSAYANRYWPPVALTNWTLSLNNGVAYITSSQFAEHCSYNRGQINMDGTEFNKAQYAYVMSAKARGKKLWYVVDKTQTTCIISGLQEAD